MINKSILIIKTPAHCEECKFHQNTSYSTFECLAIYKNGDNNENFPTWCPLLPLPERKNLTTYVNGDTSIGNILHYNYAQGFNSCLDQILGN